MPSIVGKTFKPTTFIPVSSAAVLLVGCTTLFFVFTCPWLTRTISPVVPLYNGVIFLFVLANFCMATFMDSGVFPRATEEEEDKDDVFRTPLYKNVEVKGIQVRMKWCATCHFYRPPRCSHCSVCDHCVEDFDHHCPWVNNCIGRRNYRYFFVFLLSLSVHMVGVFSFGLLFVLHHLEHLEALQTTITLAVMGVSSLFFIPVCGLTGFHMVLVARGRTTNEQVTGKFKGGVNPFTRGCCGNIEYVMCSPLAPRYTVPPKKKPFISIQAPFLQPDLADGQIAFKSKGSLDMLDSRFTQPPRADSTMDYELQSGLDESEDGLSAQALFKFHPSFGPSAKVQYYTAGEQVTIAKGHKALGGLDGASRDHDYFSEPDLELSECRSRSALWLLRSSPLPLESCSLHSRSLSLRESHQHRDHLHTHTTTPDGPSGPAPRVLFSRNGSLSYDSLLSPAGALVTGDCLAYAGLPSMGYRQQTNLFPLWGPGPPRTLLAGRLSPHGKVPSPIHCDSLSKTVMAAIQERRETEEERQLQAHSHAPCQTDSGVYDTPRVHSLHLGPCYHEAPRAPPKSRSPTPPVFSSRDNLMGPRVRTQRLHSSASQSSMTSVTSVTSISLVQMDTSSSGLQAPAHHLHCSTPPRSPSYEPQKHSAFFSTSDRKGESPQRKPQT